MDYTIDIVTVMTDNGIKLMKLSMVKKKNLLKVMNISDKNTFVVEENLTGFVKEDVKEEEADGIIETLSKTMNMEIYDDTKDKLLTIEEYNKLVFIKKSKIN